MKMHLAARDGERNVSSDRTDRRLGRVVRSTSTSSLLSWYPVFWNNVGSPSLCLLFPLLLSRVETSFNILTVSASPESVVFQLSIDTHSILSFAVTLSWAVLSIVQHNRTDIGLC